MFPYDLVYGWPLHISWVLDVIEWNTTDGQTINTLFAQDLEIFSSCLTLVWATVCFTLNYRKLLCLFYDDKEEYLWSSHICERFDLIWLVKRLIVGKGMILVVSLYKCPNIDHKAFIQVLLPLSLLQVYNISNESLLG